MKKLYLILSFVFLFTYCSLLAQLKIGFVDSDTIMDILPDVQDARQKLDQMIRDWQNELRGMESEYKKQKGDFDKSSLIMTDQTRTEAQNKLSELENKISEFRDKKFGSNGELFQKQDELMKPVQNRVFNAIQEIATDEDLDFVFDRSGDILLLYAKDEYDITAKVLEKLQLE